VNRIAAQPAADTSDTGIASNLKYHVPGRLVTADREEVRRLFTEVLPLL
jgi:hypothetical protein